ncbi:MAG TPA: ATP-binding cassette domain-containing protein [Anaerolineales bacterium]|nr:ATP-binding cassette domain-containing protein [Anaerolineales bacterium]HMV98413.1 ATP-binding cassette domain-containing protein [Anaerolineales bacterium]HMX21086.1 ATP-binding cassette domain-containing protein [Anaerolineales bacterium]HMX73204.1 ATP-binding cassette domain-containing protein [Anaerolineales bacterium]HNA56224.1 ATP-binding cassette domain-containing protein [Anaerolineales bacterium]
MSLIHVNNLTKHFKILNRREGLSGAFRDLFSGDYRTVKAVDGISFDIEAGEIVGYIGPNGAGKSTTIKMMTGILKPSSGEIRINNHIPFENRIRQAQIMGVVFGQRTQLWWDLPVIESFRILKEIYKVPQKTFDEHMGMFNELVGLKALYSQQVRTLSLGQRMLCDITASFLHNPQIVFLDEPTIGLDISIKAKIRTVIKELNEARKTTIILTTHDLGDVEALSQRVIIIDKGKKLYDGDTKKVNALFGAYRTLKVQVNDFNEGTLDALKNKLAAQFGATNKIVIAQTEEFWTDITIDQAATPLSEVLNCVMTNFSILDVRIVEIAMEDVVQRIYDGALS